MHPVQWWPEQGWLLPSFFPILKSRRVAPCAVKTCAARPVSARVVGELRAADPQGLMKQNASAGERSEAPRRRWKPGLEQHPGAENHDIEHMLKQPGGSFPEKKVVCFQFCSQILLSRLCYRSLPQVIGLKTQQQLLTKNSNMMVSFLEV